MPPDYETFVVDTNIFIDLFCGDLDAELFRLPYRICTTDFIYDEIRDPDPDRLATYGLEVQSLPGEQVQRITVLAARYRHPSRPDLSALVLALHLKTTLLTGDGNLRQAPRDLRVQVHGTLWVLDELVRHQVITPKHAARALRKMLAAGRRLPPKEAQRFIKKWEGA